MRSQLFRDERFSRIVRKQSVGPQPAFTFPGTNTQFISQQRREAEAFLMYSPQEWWRKFCSPISKHAKKATTVVQVRSVVSRHTCSRWSTSRHQ